MKALRRSLSALLLSALVASPARSAVDVQLVGRVNLPNSVFLVNVVGYVDQATLREYAIVGDNHDKVYIVDVTDPADARITAQIDGVPGFDVKTWDHYLYTCDGNPSLNDSRVIDILDPSNPVVHPVGFPSAHTLQISSAGILYAEFPGLRIYDLNASPTAPTLLFETGGEGHDCTPKGTNRLYDFHGTTARGNATVIWDVTDPANPDTLGIITNPVTFHHSGDVTEDERYLYICDELATGSTPDITIWDIQDPASPVRVGQLNDAATVHNIYVIGDLAYIAYYSAGFRVYDISNPTQPSLAGQYDTSKRTGEGFIGAIGAYVYLPSGNILVCDIENGLFVFTVTPATLTERSAGGAFHLKQNVPNPFNPSTRIPFELTRGGRVTISIFDVAGRRVRSLLDRDFTAGTHQTGWDGRDDAGRLAASGVYFYRMQSGSHSETRRMVLVK